MKNDIFVINDYIPTCMDSQTKALYVYDDFTVFVSVKEDFATVKHASECNYILIFFARASI